MPLPEGCTCTVSVDMNQHTASFTFCPLHEAAGEMYAALERIERWFGEFPDTGQTWPDGEKMSYAAAFGSNGERDYMREVARAALAKANPSAPQPRKAA